MIHCDYEAAEKLAADIRSTHQAIDQALADVATLTNSVIEVCRSSNAPPSQTQAAIEGMAIGLTKMVDARKGFVIAHRKIVVAQRDSNLKEIGFGCVGDGPITKPAGLRVVNG